jgi:hypothetical protein
VNPTGNKYGTVSLTLLQKRKKNVWDESGKRKGKRERGWDVGWRSEDKKDKKK